MIFGKTLESGTEFLENLIGEVKYKNVNKLSKSRFNIFAELKDGTIYQVVPASQSSRGYKCDKAYIQNGVDQEIIENVIRPMLICSCLPEEEQMEYF